MSSRSRARPSWPLSTCQPSRVPPNCSLRAVDLDVAVAQSRARRRTPGGWSRPAGARPGPPARSPGRAAAGRSCPGARPATRRPAAAAAATARRRARARRSAPARVSSACACRCSGDTRPGPKAPRSSCWRSPGGRARRRWASSTSSVDVGQLAGCRCVSGLPAPRLAAGHAVEQVVDVALAVGVALQAAACTPRGRDAVDLDLAPRQQRLAGAATAPRRSMPAKRCCGWPGSDRRTPCTVTAGCGHSCSVTGPSKTSSRAWWACIQSMADALDALAIEAEHQPRRQPATQQQQGGQRRTGFDANQGRMEDLAQRRP